MAIARTVIPAPSRPGERWSMDFVSDLTWSGRWVARLRMSDSVWESVADLPADATSCHDTGLESGQEYLYVVSVAYPDNWNADYYNYAALSVTMPP